jgi:hypothetical protein
MLCSDSKYRGTLNLPLSPPLFLPLAAARSSLPDLSTQLDIGDSRYPAINFADEACYRVVLNLK